MISYEMFSDTGTRSCNEDRVGSERLGNEYGFFLADGLGGYGRGNIASFIAVEEAKLEFFREGASVDCMDRIFQKVQESIRMMQREERRERSMHTTLCMLLISEIDVRWGHIGDSRVYYFQDGVLCARTKDQSVPQMLASSGLIQPSEIRFHPDRGKLLECIGSKWEGIPYVCADSIPRKGRQDFLLCSDGFWEWVEEAEMERCLQVSDSAKTWMKKMTELVRLHGMEREMDNYSAVSVCCRT